MSAQSGGQGSNTFACVILEATVAMICDRWTAMVLETWLPCYRLHELFPRPHEVEDMTGE